MSSKSSLPVSVFRFVCDISSWPEISWESLALFTSQRTSAKRSRLFHYNQRQYLPCQWATSICLPLFTTHSSSRSIKLANLSNQTGLRMINRVEYCQTGQADHTNQELRSHGIESSSPEKVSEVRRVLGDRFDPRCLLRATNRQICVYFGVGCHWKGELAVK